MGLITTASGGVVVNGGVIAGSVVKGFTSKTSDLWEQAESSGRLTKLSIKVLISSKTFQWYS